MECLQNLRKYVRQALRNLKKVKKYADHGAVYRAVLRAVH